MCFSGVVRLRARRAARPVMATVATMRTQWSSRTCITPRLPSEGSEGSAGPARRRSSPRRSSWRLDGGGNAHGDGTRLDMGLEALHRGPDAAIEIVGALVTELDDDPLRPLAVDERREVGAILRNSREDPQPLPRGVRGDDPNLEQSVGRRGVREHGKPAGDRADVADEQTACLALEPDLAVQADFHPHPPRTHR